MLQETCSLVLSMQKQIEDEIGCLEVEVILARGKLNWNDFIKETPETTEPSTQTGLQAKTLGEDQKRYPKFYTYTNSHSKQQNIPVSSYCGIWMQQCATNL